MPLALPGGCAVAPATRTVASAPASKRINPEARFMAPSSHVAPSRPVGTARRGGVYEGSSARAARKNRQISAVRLRHLPVVERLVEGGVVDAFLPCHFAERTA